MRRTSRTTTSICVFAGQDDRHLRRRGRRPPVADNVSFWFYLKGWRGLVVEPQQALADIYAHVRPRDHTVSCLAGRAEGEAEFHVVDKLHGFSTTVREHAAGTGQFGTSLQDHRQAGADAGGADRRGRARRPSISSRSTWRGRRPTCWPAWISRAGARAWCWWRRWRRAAWPRPGARGSPISSRRAIASPSSTASTASTWPRRPRTWPPAFPPSPRPGTASSTSGTAAVRRSGPTIPTTSWRRCCSRASSRSCRRSSRRCCAASSSADWMGSDPMALAPPRPPTEPWGLTPLPPSSAPPSSRGRQRPPPADLAALLETDQLRAALGRIACMYDGGHLLE